MQKMIRSDTLNPNKPSCTQASSNEPRPGVRKTRAAVRFTLVGRRQRAGAHPHGLVPQDLSSALVADRCLHRRGVKGGKGGSNELWDALVIFGNGVTIFSDKHINYQADRNWNRIRRHS